MSPPKIGRAPQTGVGTPTRRPTTEDWHRAASLLTDTPLTSNPNPPKQQAAPLDSDQRPPTPRLTRMGYWLAVIAIAFLTFVLAGGLNPSQQTQIDGSTILIFLVMYLPVAVLRTRDMGASWWSSVVIIFVVGALFFIFLFLWIGIAKSIASLQQWNLNKPLPIIAAIVCVFFAIMAVIIVLPITTVPQPSGTNPTDPPNQTDLTVCDTWLREQLDSPAVTSVQNANAAITDIQANRPNQCAPSAWNPVVDNVAKDYVGNIDVKFWITNTNLRGTAVTLPADDTPRWVYLAKKRQWYSSKLDGRSVLITPPTASNQSAPTTARPNYTSLPSTTGAATVRQALPTPTIDPRSIGEIQGGNEDYFIGAELAALNNGQDLFYQGRYEEALEEFKKAQETRLAGQSWVLENWIAITYRVLGDHEKAIEHHTNAIGIKDSGTNRIGRAGSYAQTGQWHLAVTDAEAALAMEAEQTKYLHIHAEAHVLLATWYAVQGEVSLTYDHASKALAIMSTIEYNPISQAAAHKLKGVAQATLGQQGPAIETYSEAIFYGDDAQLRSLRASTYLAENRCPEATTDANAALMMEPVHEVGYHSDAEANAVLGVCSHLSGDHVSAEHYLIEALVIMQGTEYQVEVTQYWTELLTKIRQEKGR